MYWWEETFPDAGETGEESQTHPFRVPGPHPVEPPDRGPQGTKTQPYLCYAPLEKRDKLFCTCSLVCKPSDVCSVFFRTLYSSKLDTIVFFEIESSLFTNVFSGHMVIGQC